MMGKEKIEKIEEWQSSNFTHPLTCSKKNCNGILEPKEIGGRVVLKCLKCEYIQKFIPQIILETDVKMFKNSANNIMKGLQ